MSASSAAVRAVRRLRARAFIGHSERRLVKPECISARYRARDGTRGGLLRPAACRRIPRQYSQIASESHTVSSPWRSTGTRPLGLNLSMSSRVLGVSRVISTSSKAMPRRFISSQGRSDQEE